jgi:Mlc titration factor MtfA (ptsG expression regulator)
MRLETPRQRRRRRALQAPFPQEWRDLLADRVAHWCFLDDTERERLEALVKAFLVEKEFEGAGGLTVAEDVRVTIAAQACLLLLGLDGDYYRDVHSIIVYPSTVMRRGPQGSAVLPGAVTEEPAALLGEARLHGPMVIVWDQALAQARHPERGHNVVYHEFAHKIDMADGAADGTPPQRDRAAHRRWAEVVSREFTLLRQRAEAGRPTLLDAYGAANPVEFFAVATEAFFDLPVSLQSQHPDLYGVLAEFYHQDPASRVRRCPPEALRPRGEG